VVSKKSIGSELRSELALEAAVTRRFLEQVPFDRLAYKPTERSETLGGLAVHVVEIIAWWSSVVKSDRLDFENFESRKITTREALLDYFDALLSEALYDLATAEDQIFQSEWAMTNGDEVHFKLPKKQVVRIFCMNHLVHHRAQLGVYLRLLGIGIPATYGPSADDEHVLLINPF
jgi:uncharacterized damage-inducible protein DinB